MSVGKRVLSVSGWVLLAILLAVTCLYIIPKSGTHDLRGYIREITEENGCTVISLTSVFSTDEQPDTYLLRVENAHAIRSTEGGSLSVDGLTVGQMVDVNVREKRRRTAATPCVSCWSIPAPKHLAAAPSGLTDRTLPIPPAAAFHVCRRPLRARYRRKGGGQLWKRTGFGSALPRPDGWRII